MTEILYSPRANSLAICVSVASFIIKLFKIPHFPRPNCPYVVSWFYIPLLTIVSASFHSKSTGQRIFPHYSTSQSKSWGGHRCKGGGSRLHLVKEELACVDSGGVGWGRIIGMHCCRQSALSETLSSWKCLKAWQYTLQASLWGLSYFQILLGVVKNSIACTKGIFPLGQNYKCIYPWTKVPPLAEIDHRSFNRVIQLEKREKIQKNRETFFKK